MGFKQEILAVIALLCPVSSQSWDHFDSLLSNLSRMSILGNKNSQTRLHIESLLLNNCLECLFFSWCEMLFFMCQTKLGKTHCTLSDSLSLPSLFQTLYCWKARILGQSQFNPLFLFCSSGGNNHPQEQLGRTPSMINWE